MGCIAACAGTRRVRRMCQVLGVASSSYYAWRGRQRRTVPTPRVARHQAVTERIRIQHAAADGRLGRRSMQQVLFDRDGIACSLGMVHRIMAEQRLSARRHRRRVTTTRHDPAARIGMIPNHLATAAGRCDFDSALPGTRTVGDLTYLRTDEGWMYLYTVLDLATRAVIGWSLQDAPTAAGAVAALAMAAARGRLAPGAIFHSDHGTQYTSSAFQHWCARAGVRQSMGRTGVCWDNAVAEAFFATLKGDLGHGRRYASRGEARCVIVGYIEGWYNRQRPHSHNGGRPPLIAWDEATWPPSTLHQT
jgi:transposase InsO family protein